MREGNMMWQCKKCNSVKFNTRFFCACGAENENGFSCYSCGDRIHISKVYCASCGDLDKEYVDGKTKEDMEKEKKVDKKKQKK